MATAAQRLVTEATLKNQAPTPVVNAATRRFSIAASEKKADGTYGSPSSAELGNTFVRNITALCSNIVAGTVELIRAGQVVQVSLNGVRISAGLGPGGVVLIAGTGQQSDPLFSNYRTGFYNDASSPVVINNGPNVGRLVLNRNGALTLYGVTASDTIFGTISTVTDRVWPESTLIGTSGAPA